MLVQLFQEVGDPIQGPEVGSCLTLGNELSEETDKARDFTGKGCLGGEQEGFMVMGLVSRLSLASHSDSVPGGALIAQ